MNSYQYELLSSRVEAYAYLMQQLNGLSKAFAYLDELDDEESPINVWSTTLNQFISVSVKYSAN